MGKEFALNCWYKIAILESLYIQLYFSTLKWIMAKATGNNIITKCPLFCYLTVFYISFSSELHNHL